MQLRTLDLSGRKVPLGTVNTVLRTISSVSWRKIRDPGLLVNTDRSKVLRQQHAFILLNLLNEKRRIINIDESSFDSTTFARYGWQLKDARSSGVVKPLGARITMIAAIDTEGCLWYSISHGTNTGATFSSFLYYLSELLKEEVEDW